MSKEYIDACVPISTLYSFRSERIFSKPNDITKYTLGATYKPWKCSWFFINTINFTSITQKVNRTYKPVLEGAVVGVLWSSVPRGFVLFVV